jgi:hypothetical protein
MSSQHSFEPLAKHSGIANVITGTIETRATVHPLLSTFPNAKVEIAAEPSLQQSVATERVVVPGAHVTRRTYVAGATLAFLASFGGLFWMRRARERGAQDGSATVATPRPAAASLRPLAAVAHPGAAPGRPTALPADRADRTTDIPPTQPSLQQAEPNPRNSLAGLPPGRPHRRPERPSQGLGPNDGDQGAAAPRVSAAGVLPGLQGMFDDDDAAPRPANESVVRDQQVALDE